MRTEREKIRDKKWHVEYYAKKPWLLHLGWSRKRSKKMGRKNTLTKDEIEFLWHRDKAFSLDRPSIDRINPSRGYVLENCRFIELIENIRLGSIGRKITEKRRKASSKNLKDWIKKDGGKRSMKSVVVYDMSGDMIRSFKSMKLASKYEGVAQSMISRYISGDRKPKNGHIWKLEGIINRK